MQWLDGCKGRNISDAVVGQLQGQEENSCTGWTVARAAGPEVMQCWVGTIFIPCALFDMKGRAPRVPCTMRAVRYERQGAASRRETLL